MSCSVCHKHVKKNHRKLCCSICKNYVHKSCSDLTAKEFRRKNTESFWHCEICNNEIMLPFNHILDEREFKLVLFTLFEHQNIVNKEDIIEKYRNLTFDPHKFNDKDDFNEYNSNSDYYDNEQLKEVCKNIEKNDLSLLNINARSLYKNFESLQDFLGSIDIEFKIIGLVETWLKDQPQEYFHIDGYNLELKNRRDKKGGGVCLYIDDDIKYTVRKDLEKIKHPDYTETLFIEIERQAAKNIIVGVLYKPPDQDIKVFNTFAETLLCKIAKNENKLVYLMGDFNINLINEDIHVPITEFIDMLSSYSLYPSITKPTRITSKTATLIDNIFTNSHTKQTAGIIISDISDHLPIFTVIKLSVYRHDHNIQFEKRDYNVKNVQMFKDRLRNENWDEVCISDDVNVSYRSFVNRFVSLYDECIPKKLITKCKNSKTPKSPWITNALLKCINRKNSLYKKSLNKPTDTNISKYKMYRNKLNISLRLAKQNHFSSLLEKEKHNMKNTWKILNSVLRSSKKPLGGKFVDGNKTFSDSKEIANEFNNFFANIGPSLAASIKHKGKDFNSYLRDQNSYTCFLKPTDVEEIYKVIRNLGNNKSPGHDNISSNIIKKVAKEILYPFQTHF